MERKNLPKLRNDEIIVIKPSDNVGAVVILSTSHYQSMIHLLDENTYKKLNYSIKNKIRNSLLRFLRQYKIVFIEPNWKFLNDKHHEKSSFYGLPTICKSKTIEFVIKTQNRKMVENFEPYDLNLRPIVGGLKSQTRKQSQLIDILSKSFLKHIKSFIAW